MKSVDVDPLFSHSQLIALLAVFIALFGACGGSGPASSGSSSKSASAPTVAATSATYATAGAPFQALPSSSGGVFVSVAADNRPGSTTGVEVFATGPNGLQSSCVNASSSVLQGSGAAPANLSFFPGAIDVAAGIGYPGAIFYHAAELRGCTDSGYVVDQASSSGNPGTLAVAVTPDGNFAFVSNEYGIAPGATTRGNIGVVAIQR